MKVIFLSDLHITSDSSPDTSPWVDFLLESTEFVLIRSDKGKHIAEYSR